MKRGTAGLQGGKGNPTTSESRSLTQPSSAHRHIEIDGGD